MVIEHKVTGTAAASWLAQLADSAPDGLGALDKTVSLVFTVLAEEL